MADDNIIDISGQLPAADLHTRWRQRLPERYVKHLDSLKAHYEQVIAMRRTLNVIHDELHVDVGQLSPLTRRTDPEEDAMQYIRDALVLLECAQDKLIHTRHRRWIAIATAS